MHFPYRNSKAGINLAGQRKGLNPDQMALGIIPQMWRNSNKFMN